MDEVPTLAALPMVTVRVFLACTSPTKHGSFSTFVALPDDAYARGDHLRVACARALLLGYGGPHHVVEARRVDGGGIRPEDQRGVASATVAAPPGLLERLMAAVPTDYDHTEGVDAPSLIRDGRVPLQRQLPRRRGRSSAR